MNILMKRGELKKRATQANTLSKINSLTTTINDFKDIRITTTQQWLRDQAAEKAWSLVSNVNEVNATINHLLETEFTKAYEFVNITRDEIVIGVETPSINDQAIGHAIFLLTQIPNFNVGTSIEFKTSLNQYAQNI